MDSEQDEDVTLESMNRGIGGARDGVAAEYFVCDQVKFGMVLFRC